nr:type VI secretion system tip protein TssI/VgrG [uncultured Moellerella sp.]
MPRTITFHSSAMPTLLGEPALMISMLEGEESLSNLYTYTITAKTPANPAIPWQSASNLDLKSLIGQQVAVVIELDGNGLDFGKGLGKGAREITGIVQKARYIGRDDYQAMYELTITPWLTLATLTTDFKIFQQKSVVQIIDEVLSEYNFPYEKRLSSVYPALDFQVQYGETDFDFVQRLMEEWGIYWFFEHKDYKNRLILVDHVGAHRKNFSPAYHTLRYEADTPKDGEEYVSQFHAQELITSGQWLTSDYDFKKSRADISALDKKPRKTNFNQFEVFSWPGDYEEPSVGEFLARVRSEERGMIGARSSGYGEIRSVVCGTTFNLTNFPQSKANREYLVISSHITVTEINQQSDTDGFSVFTNFVVQPTTKIYRHPQIIPKPATSGPQTALVVGPPGEEVWTDEYGRVKVRFLWDRYGNNTESDSCWIRVGQAWAGSNFGGIYIPRIGQEVIVDFLHGDPDRPLIIGSLYNNVTRPPWDLPANATQSGLISRTIGGGTENYNGVRFEDLPGIEEYWEQAERNMNRLVKNDELHEINHDLKQVVANDRSLFVGRNATEVIGHNNSQIIGLNHTQAVGLNSTQIVGLTSSVTIGLLHALTVGGAFVTAVGGAVSTVVGLTYSLNVAGASSDNVGAGKFTNVGGAYVTSVGGGYINNVGGAYSVAAGGAIQSICGGAMTMTAGAGIVMGAGGEICIAADIVKIIGKSKLILQGGTTAINPGDCGCGVQFGTGGGSIGPLFVPPIALPGFMIPIINIKPGVKPTHQPPTPPPTDTPQPTSSEWVTPSPTPLPTPLPTPSPIIPTATPFLMPIATPFMMPMPPEDEEGNSWADMNSDAESKEDQGGDSFVDKVSRANSDANTGSDTFADKVDRANSNTNVGGDSFAETVGKVGSTADAGRDTLAETVGKASSSTNAGGDTFAETVGKASSTADAGSDTLADAINKAGRAENGNI